MRVSDRSLSALTQHNLARRYSDVFDKQQQATTGLRVNRPSDDPRAAAELARLNSALTLNAQYEQNASEAAGEVEAADTALFGLTEVLNRAHELALAMANGSASTEDRAAAALEIADLREQAITLANTRFGSRYIFAGHQSTSPAVDVNGIYLGDAGHKQIDLGDGQTADVGVNGNQVFTAVAGVDLFNTLSAAQSALAADDLVQLASAIDDLDQSASQVISARSTIGRQGDRFAARQRALSDIALVLTQQQSRLGDADLVETLSGLAEAQSALNTAVEVSARMLSTLSLVDRL